MQIWKTVRFIIIIIIIIFLTGVLLVKKVLICSHKENKWTTNVCQHILFILLHVSEAYKPMWLYKIFCIVSMSTLDL